MKNDNVVKPNAVIKPDGDADMKDEGNMGEIKDRCDGKQMTDDDMTRVLLISKYSLSLAGTTQTAHDVIGASLTPLGHAHIQKRYNSWK